MRNEKAQRLGMWRRVNGQFPSLFSITSERRALAQQAALGAGTGNIVRSRAALNGIRLQPVTRRALAGFPAEAKRRMPTLGFPLGAPVFFTVVLL